MTLCHAKPPFNFQDFGLASQNEAGDWHRKAPAILSHQRITSFSARLTSANISTDRPDDRKTVA